MYSQDFDSDPLVLGPVEPPVDAEIPQPAAFHRDDRLKRGRLIRYAQSCTITMSDSKPQPDLTGLGVLPIGTVGMLVEPPFSRPAGAPLGH